MTLPVYDPADHLPESWKMGELVSIDTLEPEYRDFAQSFGATHVRLINVVPVSDEVFHHKISAFLDQSYAGDAACLAAKAAGQVNIRRQSDVLAELGDTRAGDQSMAFFRGLNGSEHFGGGGTGIPSQAFDGWWAAQNAAGQSVEPGGAMGLNFVASWKTA